MQIPLFQVDAFTDRPFGGNPAAVCPLDSWLPDDLMQSIAAENNLSETAFLVRASPSGASDDTEAHELRWFTPEVEVELCGHATLAAGHVVLNHLATQAPSVSFSTRSGVLVVDRDPGGRLRMDLPADPRPVVTAPDGLSDILGAAPTVVLGGATWIAVLDDAGMVSGFAGDIAAIGRLEPAYLSITAPGPTGSGIDFVSRFFAPGAGIEEDPVTGSAHCALVPYWSQRLGRDELRAQQVSPRGGELHCELVDDRVVLRGGCVEVLTGTLTVPESGRGHVARVV